MSKITAFGCLIAAILFVGPALGQTNQQPPTDINTKTQQQQQAAASGPVAEKEKLTSDEYQNPCGPTEKAYVADLCEQRRMAEAAKDQVFWIKAQFWSNLGQIVGLILTVIFTAIAASAASKSARAAQASADWLIRVERPYLVPVEARLERFDASTKDGKPRIAEIHFCLLNVGKSPAFIRGVGITEEICALEHHGKKIVQAPSEMIGQVFVRSDAKWSPSIPFHVFQLDDDIRQKVIENDLTIYIYGFIRYADAFGIIRRSGFAFEFIPGDFWNIQTDLVPSGPRSLWYDREEKPDEAI